MPKVKLQCSYCHKDFLRYPSEVRKGKLRGIKNIFCSMSCRSGDRKSVSVPCAFCGVYFKRKLSLIERSEKNYCSHGCYTNDVKEDRLCPLGYIRYWTEGKYRYRHRQIMEEYLCRPLLKDEVVHHKNGDRTDNRLENLQLMALGEHTKMHTLDRKKEMKSCPFNGKNADPKKVFSHNIKESVCLQFWGNGKCTTIKNCPIKKGI